MYQQYQTDSNPLKVEAAPRGVYRSPGPSHYQANIAQLRQSRPYDGLRLSHFQVIFGNPVECFPPSTAEGFICDGTGVPRVQETRRRKTHLH